ncbi:lipoprotein NlpD [Mariprofundus micogutta]|uniref:Lipoprotein NlpD n=1 Tax=Mariprofundus micogutta TaxID=1921010 RepID=A0A1L8CQ15_9PROT|nr:M23 family metallopeptidase [Mariprofundus micogutta]GAV20919.1 lipoprotein NlpD [Mariprofundus micogutta]
MGLIGRLLCLLLLLAVAGCYSTPMPRSKSHHKPSASKSVGKKIGKPVIRYVRPQDTLYSIGKKFGVHYKLIAMRNRIPYPYRIYVGQRLYIDRWAPKGTYDPTAAKIRKASKPRQVAKKSSKKSVQKPRHKTKATGGKLRWPVRGKVTSRFGRRGSRMHDGVDIGAKEGAPIHAAASGTVVYSDHRLSGYGNLVIIRHGNNLFTAYGHNQRNLVRKGQNIKAGDVIARVGHTGRASGPHLHFEVRQGSVAVDPLAYLPR